MIPNTKFKAFREGLNLTQTEFAASLGISQATITDIERGRIGISKRVMRKINEKYNIEVGYFNTDKIQQIDSRNAGSEVGLKEGSDIFPKDQAINDRANSRMKELLAGQDQLKIFEKQKVITEKVIGLLCRNNKKYNDFRSSVIAIQAFEDILNDLSYSNELNKLFNITYAARNYMNKGTMNDLKQAMEADFKEIERHATIFADLAKALQQFAKRYLDKNVVTDIDREEFEQYLELLS